MKTPKSFNVLMAIAILGLSLTGCSDTKVAECNKLIEVANEGNKAVNEFDAADPSVGPEAFKQTLTGAATKIDDAVAKVQALKLEDDKLKGFQPRFVDVYQAISLAGTALSEIDLKTTNPADLEPLLKAVDEAKAEGSALVKEANSYCLAS